MESNDCYCINLILRQFLNALRSVAQTSNSVLQNTNLPATDSGFVSSNQVTPQISNNNWLSFDNGLFALIIMGCILGYLITTGKKQKSTIKK
jgi:hypothetical protein